jgi:hypothetical protein
MTSRAMFPGASTPTTPILNAGTPLGFETQGCAASVPLTGIPSGATYALVSCTGANVNWRDDGVAPTALVGNQITAGQPPIALTNLAALKFIQQAATAALNVSFYK